MGRSALAVVVLLSSLVCATQAKSYRWSWLQFGDSQEDYDYSEEVSESKAHAEADSYSRSYRHRRKPAESKPHDDGVDDDEDEYDSTPKPTGGSGHQADTSNGGSSVTEGPLTTEASSDSQNGSGTITGTSKPGTAGTDKPDEADDFDRPDYLDMADTPSKDKAVDRARIAFYGDKKGEMLLPEGYGVRYGAGTKNPALRWPKATIPYEIDSSLEKIKNKISRAMDTYHNETCIRFVPRSNEKNYIYITKGQGCSSYVGMSGGRQEVSIGSGCEYVGTILHELGHACGLYHEHQRSDRDDYLMVYIGNVTQGAEDQFKKINPDDEAIYTKFDYDSIMIYGNYAFSKKPNELKTMESKNSSKKLDDPYNKQNLDDSDLYTVRNLYQCNGTTTNNF